MSTRYGKAAGEILEHNPGHLLPGGGRGLPHFQFDDIPARHIFYTSLAAMLGAATSEASEDRKCASGCSVEVEEIYEYTMDRFSIFNAWTFSYHFGEGSLASYLDWVNPLELVAMGAQAGRDIDRYLSMKLVGSILTITCDDGSEATVTLDLDGRLRSVSMDMDGKEGLETLPGIEYLDKFERGEVPPIPGFTLPR